MFHVPNQYRFTKNGHPYSSTIQDGNNGAFYVRSIKYNHEFKCIASDQDGWEHVSVSLNHRCPTWEEMCFIKNLFWDKEDCVVQYHPAEKDYVNCYPFCLHLWRPIEQEIILPPTYMV